MDADRKKLVLGGAAALILLIAAVLIVRSLFGGSGDQTTLDDETASGISDIYGDAPDPQENDAPAEEPGSARLGNPTGPS